MITGHGDSETRRQILYVRITLITGHRDAETQRTFRT